MKIDDFESMFRSAVQAPFTYQRMELERVCLVTDLRGQSAEQLAQQVRDFLRHQDSGDSFALELLDAECWEDSSELLSRVLESDPQLVITHRLLRHRSKQLRASLGSALDALLEGDFPVLILPETEAHPLGEGLHGTERVMVVTDHLTGDDRIVGWGIHMTPLSGKLYLAHVEDQATFDRYAELLSLLPGIPTEQTVERLQRKLLERPRRYIESVMDALRSAGVEETILAMVCMGHPLEHYQQLIRESDTQLLICNTHLDEHHHIHPLAHALAIELREFPLLLI